VTLIGLVLTTNVMKIFAHSSFTQILFFGTKWWKLKVNYMNFSILKFNSGWGYHGHSVKLSGCDPTRDGPWPELTFDLQQIRGWPAFDPGTFWSDPKEKIEIFTIFRGNFPNPNHRWLTWPDPDQKFWTRTHH